MTNTAQKIQRASVNKQAVRAEYPHANASGPNDGWQIFDSMLCEKALSPKCKTASEAWQAAFLTMQGNRYADIDYLVEKLYHNADKAMRGKDYGIEQGIWMAAADTIENLRSELRAALAAAVQS